MSSRPHTPGNEAYSSIPHPNDPTHLSRGYGTSTPSVQGGNSYIASTDFASNPTESSPLSHSMQQSSGFGKFTEEFDGIIHGSSSADGAHQMLQRSTSTRSNKSAKSVGTTTPSRSGTLKKQATLSRKSSLRRSGSRRSLRAGSIKGVQTQDAVAAPSSENSIFHTPVPTTGNPTEVLANRFQAWRKLLKDLITYFREVQTSYETRSKALLKVSNVITNTNAPGIFLSEGGINDANRLLRDYYKQSVLESNKARDIENEVVAQLSGLRADLASKIKEIKSLSGDFKNTVEKEKEQTRKACTTLEEAVRSIDSDTHAITGKGDPYVIRLGVERQVEKQIDEENYLHRAYLNLEGSGRELESIIVGEIQKAYNALSGILKREADEAYDSVEKLRTGPIAMNKDLEWTHFVERDPSFVNPNLPLRRLQDIDYPGKDHPAAAEVRAGMLERKSKYLKSYTPGWYVLSPTHIHEFKSADRINAQAPVMSLYLPDQKLGTHSQPGSSSHKFILKGRQTGAMHRGHSWVFRAESYDTMLAWYEDIRNLIDKSGEERNAFVRRHTRSISQGSVRSSISDSGSMLDEDEADAIPYSANASLTNNLALREEVPQRPSPGGRFPSDFQVNGHLQAPLSHSSGSSDVDNDLTTAAGAINTEHHQPKPIPLAKSNILSSEPTRQQPEPALSTSQQLQYQNTTQVDGSHEAPTQTNTFYSVVDARTVNDHPQPSVDNSNDQPLQNTIVRHDSNYGGWMGTGATTAGVAVGAVGSEADRPNQQVQQPAIEANQHNLVASGNKTNYPQSIASEMTTLSAISTDGPPTPTATALGSPPPAIRAPLDRNNTDFSVSDLHVPGEFPKQTHGGRSQ